MNAETTVSLEEALSHYLSGAGVAKAGARKSTADAAGKLGPYGRQELHRFGRFIGLARSVSDLMPPEVAGYAEFVVRSGGDVKGRLEPVKDFLVYLKKEGLTKRDESAKHMSLSAHVKIPRATMKAAAAAEAAFETIDMTESGLEAAKAELAALKGQRGGIVEAIRIAAADKDFRENAPLDAAKDEQGQAEARIRELEEIIRRAVVVDTKKQSGQAGVGLGATVALHDIESGKEVSYTLVDSIEANPSEMKISIASPVGEAIAGRTEGDQVEVKTPKGARPYRIVSVKF